MLLKILLCISLSSFAHTVNEDFYGLLCLSGYWQNINFSRNCPRFYILTTIVISEV